MRGYSLIELLVVLALFSLLILVATQSLILSLQGSTKSEAIGRVKENLEYTVSVMDRQLHNAKSITPCPNANPERLDYLDQNGRAAYFECKDVGASNKFGYIASGSATVAASVGRITGSDISITACAITVDPTTCFPLATTPTQVTVELTAEDITKTVGAQKAQATSKSTILLRQY